MIWNLSLNRKITLPSLRRGARRTAAGALCLALLLCLTPAKAVGTSATSAVLMDADSGRVLYAQNENAKMLIASTTKIMTALVAIENGDLSREWTVKKQETLVEGTSMYLREGERLTLETLLYGLLLCSGNDAALAVADAVAGSQEKFVSMMNAKARALGMTGSSFANPNGLDDEKHYSTALDMARLACAAIDNQTLMRIASTKSVTIGGRTMTNHNKLLKMVEGCIGLKTGYTRAAGRTLVSCAERNGQRLVAVTLQDGNDWVDHQQLFEYGFSTYPAKRAVSLGETVGERNGAPLIAAGTIAWPVGPGEELTLELDLPEGAASGAKAGEAVAYLNGTEVGRVAVLRGKTAPPSLPAPMESFHDLSRTFSWEPLSKSISQN